MIKLQYLRPQTEVFAATCQQILGASFYGRAGNGNLDEITEDAKKSELGFEFSFDDVWEE